MELEKYGSRTDGLVFPKTKEVFNGGNGKGWAKRGENRHDRILVMKSPAGLTSTLGTFSDARDD